MAAATPYAQLTGTCKIYIAPYGEPEPNINTTPGGNWVELGPTDGDQTIEESGDPTYFTDNDHQSDTKGIRAEEHVTVGFTLVGLTLENVARIKQSVAAVTASTMNGANVKRLGYVKGAVMTEYALLMKGLADSPYGNLPGQSYFPRGVFEGTSTRTRARDGRDAVENTFHVLEDDNQAAGQTLGWSTVQY